MSSPSRWFRSCTFWSEIHSITILSIGSSCWVVTQSVTCRSMHAAGVASVSWTGLCISSSALATSRSWATDLSVVHMVTPSRMDFTVSEPSFDVTGLRASVATLSCPFWYSMLTMDLASDSIHWCWVAPKLCYVR